MLRVATSMKRVCIAAGIVVILGLAAWWAFTSFGSADSTEPAATTTPPTATTLPSPEPTPTPEPLPLDGKLIVIDPGHQIGNSRHGSQIRQLVPAGNGTKKACNTTGTATNDGYAEATFNFGVGSELKTKLEALGATVMMTRDSDDTGSWGPCVDVRGGMGNKKNADAKISIHGDGSGASHHGFHIIVSTANDWREQSTRLAEAARDALEAEGFARSNYIGGGTALSLRADIATNNLSEMPTIMAELGNMRNDADAAVMKSAEGQQRFASALAAATEAFLANE